MILQFQALFPEAIQLQVVSQSHRVQFDTHQTNDDDIEIQSQLSIFT